MKILIAREEMFFLIWLSAFGSLSRWHQMKSSNRDVYLSSSRISPYKSGREEK